MNIVLCRRLIDTDCLLMKIVSFSARIASRKFEVDNTSYQSLSSLIKLCFVSAMGSGPSLDFAYLISTNVGTGGQDLSEEPVIRSSDSYHVIWIKC